MFKGLNFLLKLYWKYSKSSLIYLFLSAILTAIIPFASIILPKFIIDELIYNQRLPYIILYVGVLLLVGLFGGTLSSFLQTKYFLKGIDVCNEFSMDMCHNLYIADLENIESQQFLDLERKAQRFLNADGFGFGGILQKSVNILSQSITLIGIISIISVLNPLIVILFIGIVLLTTYFNSKVKKSNIELDLERPSQERKLSYDESLFSEYSFAKEIRVNTLGKWLMDRLKNRYAVLKGFYVKMNYNNLKSQIFSIFSNKD